ncbi:MAG TPA: penicillin-binding protein [Actinomycetes bacterium]|nr:penicillin-binding protein [Actinomycetes bacterium]
MAFPSPSSSSKDGLATRIGLFVGLSVLAGLLVAGLALPAVGLIGLTAKRGAENFQSLPAALKVPPLKQRSRILAADGTVLATFYSQNRVYVPLDKISPEMQDAIVAIEDARFYEHNGIDLIGTIRAVLANTQAGGVTQGGSTLTQQYVKNVLASTGTRAERKAATEDSISRKIRELRYALGLEQRWSKGKILEGYLNIAYFGSQAYGVEVASQRYFSKPASDLNAGEAATIAGIVKYPSLYDPLVHPNQSEKRRDVVLQRMVDLGKLSQEEADKYKAQSLEKMLHPSEVTRGCAVSKVPFFCAYVEETFLSDPAYGKTRADRRALLNGGGLTIRTTLNMQAQESAQTAVEARVPIGDPSGRVAAIAMIQPGTGDVEAMAQSLNFGTGPGKSNINNAVDDKFNPRVSEGFGGSLGQQPGSTFKAFTLAAAIEAGFPINESLSAPYQRTFPYGSFENCDGGTVSEWPVKNFTTSENGSYDMRTGTALSVNTYFAELARRVGLCNVMEAASRAGVTDAYGHDPATDTNLQYGPSIIGGAFGVTPLTMAEGYATFAARGKHCDPYVITQITTHDKNEIPVSPRQCNQAFDPEVADAVNSILGGVIDGNIAGRTGAQLGLGRPAAGKTGTTDDNRAVWFVGYTPDLAAAVWAGHPDAPADYPMEDVTIGGQYYPIVYGSSLPGPIWQAAMIGALEGVPATSFTPMNPDLIDGKTITVPSLVGLSEEEATSRIEKLGLTAQVADYDVASYQEKGLVAYTSPGAGAGVSPSTTVTIYLSSGEPPPPSPTPSNSDSGGGNNSPSPSETSGGGNAKPDKPNKPGNGHGNGHGQGHGQGNGGGNG